MKITFLGQGFTSDLTNSVGNYLIKFLSSDDFHSFTALSAFASSAGVNGLSKYLLKAKDTYSNINIIVGIDQKGTSKEALESLLSLNLNSYVFYQPSSTIFHPKIYLFEGTVKDELIIGSSNLTASGLFSNIESSRLISLEKTSEDLKIISELKNYYKGIFDLSDPNLEIISAKLINLLFNEKIIPIEEVENLINYKFAV